MDPPVYGPLYDAPIEYKPPDDIGLSDDIEYPNLNSRNYLKQPLNRTPKIYKNYEFVTLNDDENIIIATNKLSGREWFGTIWGFENLHEISKENSSFSLQSLSCGKVQLWSTISAKRDEQNAYHLYCIGEKHEHVKPIVSMDVYKTCNTKVVTGSKDGTLKLWDTSAADLISYSTIRFAHCDTITDISTSYNNENVWATCSLDKSCLLFDERQTRPAIALIEDYKVRFNALTWSEASNDGSSEHIIHIGDETGYILDIDIRAPHQIMDSVKYFDRSIKKIIPKGDNLAVIGNTNVVKISKTANHDIFYENNDSTDFVRDGIWRKNNNELLTVGFDGCVRSHLIHNQQNLSNSVKK